MTQKTWTRHFQAVKGRPTKKYHFTEHLKRLGDYVETEPISKAERLRMKDAAKYWAYRNDKRLRFWSYPASPDTYICRVTLVALTRKEL